MTDRKSSDTPTPPALKLRRITEEEFRRVLIEAGQIEPWQPTPDGGAFAICPPLLPPDPAP